MLQSVRAESVKLTSLKGPRVAALGTMVAVVVLSGILTALTQTAISEGRADEVAGLEPGTAFLVVLQYGQVGVILFGSWLILEERERGNLRTTMLAMPSRRNVFFAKCTVAASGSLLIGVVSVLGAHSIRSTIISGPLTEGGHEDTRVLAGYIVYWTLLGVLSFALSTLVRNGLVGMGVMLALVLALSPYLSTLSPLARYLPDQAGAQLYQELPRIGTDLGPSMGFIVLVVWVLFVMVAGALSLRTWAVHE